MTKLTTTATTALLMPFLVGQGIRVRRTTPRLPGAAGPTAATTGGTGEQFHLVVLGESTAAGVGAETHATALTGQLAGAMAAATGRAVSWRVVSRSGATASVVRDELVPRLAGEPADLIVVVLGVNDTKDMHSARRWTRDLLGLIIALRRSHGHVPILLTGVPPMDAFPTLPRPLRTVLGMRSRDLDAAAVRIAATVPGVSHEPTPRSVLNEETFCSDGFHPSELGYRLWAEHLTPHALRVSRTSGGPARTAPR